MRRAAKRLVSDVTSRKNKEAEFQSSGCPLRRPSWHGRADARVCARDRWVCTRNQSRRRINDLIVAVCYADGVHTVRRKIHEM